MGQTLWLISSCFFCKRSVAVNNFLPCNADKSVEDSHGTLLASNFNTLSVSKTILLLHLVQSQHIIDFDSELAALPSFRVCVQIKFTFFKNVKNELIFISSTSLIKRSPRLSLVWNFVLYIKSIFLNAFFFVFFMNFQQVLLLI